MTYLYIFGAAGDLSQRKIYPALAELFVNYEDVFSNVKVIGCARREWDDEKYREFIHESIGSSEKSKLDDSKLLENANFLNIDFEKDKDILKLNNSITHTHQDADRYIFYFAVTPEIFPLLTEKLAGLAIYKDIKSKANLLIEKPFGEDYDSAADLFSLLKENFNQENILPIDHVLNKKALIDILHFRRFNQIIENMLSKEHIDHVQITYAEKRGVEGRENFYKKTGALRDMVQGHIFEALAVLLGDIPDDYTGSVSQSSRAKLLKDLEFGGKDDFVIANASELESTETFVALKLKISPQNQRFGDMPIYIRTGKYMNDNYFDVNIVFKKNEKQPDSRNPVLTFRISPNSGISFNLWTAENSYTLESQPEQLIKLTHCYRGNEMKDAYVALLFDAVVGSQTFFVSEDEILASWKVIDSIRKHYESTKLGTYIHGSTGPLASYELIQQDNRDWIEQSSSDFC